MIKIIHHSDILSSENTKIAMPGIWGPSSQTELAYLSHFVACYRPSLRLACIEYYPMYILGDAEQRIGISFFGPQLSKRILPAGAGAEITSVRERWLVLAPVHPEWHESHLRRFIPSYGPAAGFDSIFLFDYTNSTIQIIR